MLEPGPEMRKFTNEPPPEYVPENDLARHLLLLFWLHRPLRAKYTDSSNLEEVARWLDNNDELMNLKLLEYVERDLGVTQ